MNNQRLGMVFNTTEDSYYFYDSGTGKVISCDEEEAGFIEDILTNKLSIEEARSTNYEFSKFIDEESLFLCPEKRSFMIPEKGEFKKKLESSCEQIILELTQICNMRCGYCIYNDHHPEFRGFSSKNMSFEIARKSIDYILSNYERDQFSLTFYGGEPLCNFDVMRKSIDYMLRAYPDIKLHVSFTTNLTLLSNDMVEYFSGLNVNSIDIMCSLDGPRNLHDKFRRYATGEGSFDDSLRGLNLLLNKFYDKDKMKTISINCVMSPPYSKKNMDDIKNYFFEELKLPKEIQCNYAYLDKGDMIFDFDKDEIIADDLNRKLESSPMEEWAIDNLIANRERTEYFDLVSTEMARVANRMRTEEGIISESYLHGNCLPGQRRLYITVDGDFRVCEKMGESPKLGDYKNGYEFDKIYEYYIEEYIKYFNNICNSCWARLMCSVCYERTIGENGLTPSIEKVICKGSKRIIKDLFVNYYRLMEEDKDLVAELIAKYEYS